MLGGGMQMCPDCRGWVRDIDAHKDKCKVKERRRITEARDALRRWLSK